MQDACVALLVAAPRFDPSRSSWKTFAYRRANGAITDALRANGSTWPRSVRRWRREIAQKTDRLRQAFHREPTHEEITEALDWTMNLYRRRTARIAAFESLQTIPAIEPVVTGDDASDGAVQSQRAAVLGRLIADLSPRDRWIAERYYFGGVGMKEIGEELGVNQSRVSQLHARMLVRLKGALGKDTNL